MENLIDYEILKTFIDYRNINENARKEKIDKLIKNINNKLDLSNNKENKYNIFYNELVKLLIKFKDPKLYGSSANFNIDEIKILEKNFKNFNEDNIDNKINNIKSLLNNFIDALPSYIEESNKKFIDFNNNIEKLKNFLLNYQNIVSEIDSINYNINLLNQEKKYTNDKKIVFNEYKQKYIQIDTNLLELNKEFNNIQELAIKIFKDWAFDNLNAGIVMFYKQENEFKEISKLLKEIQFTNKSNIYNELLKLYNYNIDQYYNIQNKFRIDNLKTNIKTKENLNLLTTINKINIKQLNNTNLSIKNNIDSIENKINIQSKSKLIIPFFKKGSSDIKMNIFFIIIIGLLLIVIFILENFYIMIPKCIGFIIGIIGLSLIGYGTHKYYILIKK